MVELIFIGRNSGGVVNSLEVKDVGSYGTTNVSIGVTIQYNSTVLYEDAIDTYTILKGGSITISAPYDDNGIKTGTYYTRFRVRNNDTLEVSEYNSTLELNYVPYGEDLTITVNGLTSTISCLDNNPYTGVTVTSYELYHIDPNGVRRFTSSNTLLIPATIYSGTHTFGVYVDVVWNETGITLYDRIDNSKTSIAYKLDYVDLWSQVDSLNTEYQGKLSTDIVGANRIKDKLLRCNVWQDDFDRAVNDGDTLSAYTALVYINAELNTDTIPDIEEIPVFTLPSSTYHIHQNKTDVLDLLTNVGGVLYFNGFPLEATGLTRVVALDELGYMGTKFSSNFSVNGSYKIELADVVTATSVGGVSKSLNANVDSKGRVTAISENNIQIAESQVTNLVDDLNARVLVTDYEDLDVLNKIKNVDGLDSGLDADYLRGITLGTSGGSYIPYVNSSGFFGLGIDPQYTLDVNGTARISLLNGYIKGSEGVLSAVEKVIDTDILLSDTTINNVSTTKHGFIPKLPNDTSRYFRGDGSWALIPTITGNYLDSVIAMVVDDTYDPATVSPSPLNGDRYIVLTTTLHPDFGTIDKNLAGDSLALGANDIVQYVSSANEFRIVYDSSVATSPATVTVGTDKNGENNHDWTFDIFIGAWIDRGTTTLHNSLSDLNTGVGQYYHLTSEQHDLVAGITSSYSELNYLDGTTVTSGRILFGDGIKITNDVKLFWDNVNKRLGIGTTTPEYKLSIGENTENNYLQINSSTTGTGGLLFSAIAGNNSGALFYVHDGNYMWFRTNSAERLRITSNGNVGIGTTSPSYKLDVNGTARIGTLNGLIYGTSGVLSGLSGTGFVKSNGTTITFDNSTYQPLDATLTSLAAVSGVQGDLLYASGTDTWTRLAKSTTVNSFLKNSGTNNNPVWSTISTSEVSEGTNLYFTNARAIASLLTGYTATSGTISATDSILQAIQKLGYDKHAAVTLATDNGLSLTEQVLAMGTPSNITSSSTNSITTNTHTHAITAGLGFIGNGSAQYQVPITGATPFTPTWTTATKIFGTTGLNSLTYASTAFVKMTGTNTFSLDTNTYSLSNHNHDSVYASKIHNLVDATHHPVSGLTTGHFLKATGATSYGFAAHGLTYTDVGAAAASHTHDDRYYTETEVDAKIYLKANTDNRAVDTIPNDYNSKFEIKGLKTNAAIGITDGGTYSGVLGLRAWSDSSGGASHELAFGTTNGKIYHRYGLTTTWNAWKELIESGDSRLSQWTTTGSDIYYTTGNVGIGRTPTTHKLEVAGDIYATGAVIGDISGILKGTAGVISAATGGVDYEYALTFQHSLSRSSNVINLVNDSNSPGNNKYYGTSASGVKGWYTSSNTSYPVIVVSDWSEFTAAITTCNTYGGGNIIINGIVEVGAHSVGFDFSGVKIERGVLDFTYNELIIESNLVLTDVILNINSGGTNQKMIRMDGGDTLSMVNCVIQGYITRNTEYPTDQYLLHINNFDSNDKRLLMVNCKSAFKAATTYPGIAIKSSFGFARLQLDIIGYGKSPSYTTAGTDQKVYVYGTSPAYIVANFDATIELKTNTSSTIQRATHYLSSPSIVGNTVSTGNISAVNGAFSGTLTSGNAKSIASSGYTKTAEGIIIQWGTWTSDTDDNKTVSFATTFPTACLSVTCDEFIQNNEITKYTDSFVVNRSDNVDGTYTRHYIAIGY